MNLSVILQKKKFSLFLAFKSNGLQLQFNEFKKYFIDLEQTNKTTTKLIDLLDQQEHPLLFKPFYFLHPCKTGRKNHN
jgi:hypothetical protein